MAMEALIGPPSTTSWTDGAGVFNTEFGLPPDVGHGRDGSGRAA